MAGKDSDIKIDKKNKLEIVNSVKAVSDKSKNYNNVAIVIIIIIIICIIIYSYTQFQNNKNTDDKCEDFINGSPRTDTQSDAEFNVCKEVETLIVSQENYLEKLQKQRNGN
jgi:hypothetical protein